MHLVTPEAKVICCVRDIFWILDSFEVLVSKDPTIHFYESEITNLNNVYTRTEAQFTRGPLKIALDSLKQGYYSEHNNKLLIVEYDELTKNPEQTIRSVYSFIGEEYFNHDYDNIEAQYDEYDLSMGQLGMHKVRKKVENIQRLATLPPDLYEKYSNKGYEFWR
jgi:sulfotransferase